MKRGNLLILSGRYLYVIDNITYPKKYLATGGKLFKYVVRNGEVLNTFWFLSLLLLIYQKVNLHKYGFINTALRKYIIFISNIYNIRGFMSFTPDGKVENLFKTMSPLKSIVYAHANFFSINPEVHYKVHSDWDYILVWSQQQKDNLAKIKEKHNKNVLVVGRPRETYGIQKAPDIISDRILVIGQGLLRPDALDIRTRFYKSLKKWSEISGVRIYYKPHPSEFRKKKYYGSRILAESFGFKIIPNHTSEKEIGNEFDFAIVFASSYGQELMLYGITAVQIDIEGLVDGIGWDMRNAGLYKARDMEEFNEVYSKIVKKGKRLKPISNYYIETQENLNFVINKYLEDILK